jgi:hypothetical protein
MRGLNQFLVLLCLAAVAAADDDPPRPAGFFADPNVFPIAVWVQNTNRAAEYKGIGINLYVGLWRGPTDEQLAELKRHGLHVICSQNANGLKHVDDPTIVAWMHGDEPDNAQSRGRGNGYGPPILPTKVVERADEEGRAVAAGVPEHGSGRGVGPVRRPRHPAEPPGGLRGVHQGL